MKKKTHKEFVQELKELTSEIEVIEEYKNSKEKIKFLCKKCNNIWMAQPNNILNGNKCPKCYGTPKKTHEKFLEEIKERNYKIEVLEKYIDAKTKINFKCNICSNVWKARPNQILRGCGCPKCYGTPKKTHEKFWAEFYINNSEIELIGKYKDVKTKIELKCKKCGYKWKARPNDLIRKDGKKTGCPKCAGNMNKTHQEFLDDLKKINTNIKILGEYKSLNHKILTKCNYCGHKWSPKAKSLLLGNSCPKCAQGLQTSFFEQCIYNMLKDILGINEVYNRSTMLGFELDIYIPSMKIAIEPGSWQWHKTKIEKDNEKNKKCKDCGVKLLTIYDDVDKNIKNIDFDGDLILIYDDIGLGKKNTELLKSNLKKILNYLNIEYDLTDNYLLKLKETAEVKSSRKATKKYIEELARKNKKVIIIGEYINNNTKIKTKCKKCKYEWNALPTNLLKGHGCPKCSKIFKKTTEEYREELYKINNQIEVIGEYTGAREKIEVRCKICGHIWNPAAGSLIVGHGCPRTRYDHKNIKKNK